MSGSVRFLVSAICALGLAGCLGSGGGGDGSYVEELATLHASYQIVDLVTGQVTSAGSMPDLLTDPAYRGDLMVFRKVDRQTALGSTADQLGAPLDPGRRSTHVGPVYLAVFECTQGQWQHIAGTTPWSLLQGSTVDDVRLGSQRPVIGATFSQIGDALAAYNAARSFRLQLPSNDEWEAACRAGTSSLFSWGDSLATTTAGSHALAWETAAGQRGAVTVGSRQANALGFYDMHGNVAEFTAGGELRGGSWSTPLALTRSSHVDTIDPDVAHLAVGLRLAYLPQ